MQVSMDRMGVITYRTDATKKELNPTPTMIVSYLLLPTVDNSQTALAKVNIHLSESKLKQWRRLAAEEGSIEYTTEETARKPGGNCVSQCCKGVLARLHRAKLFKTML